MFVDQVTHISSCLTHCLALLVNVPEPTTVALLAMGAAGMGIMARRARSKKETDKRN
jgi:hypothetical protein